MEKWIARSELEARIRRGLAANPGVVLLGPRQSGKTSLARRISGPWTERYFDLESPVSLERLSRPMTTLAPLRGLVVIDEVQRRPDLFPVLRVLMDRPRKSARFLLLGSASPDLLRQSAESLAGRVSFVHMGGFDIGEVGASSLRRLWWRGGLPRSFLARTERESVEWRADFIATFLERDLRQFGIEVAPLTLRRLWMMLAHYHGQLWNASEIARSLGEAHTTVKRHLDILTAALVVRQLPPWFENLGKRQVKAPKVYVRDSGLLHSLLGLSSFSALEGHPKLGASWEGFVLEDLIRIAGERNCYHWRTVAGAELDLFVVRGRRRWGIEVKYADAPGLTRSMRAALADLELERLLVVYPGTERYALGKSVEVLPLADARVEIGASVKRKSVRR
jgi:predicted AAA+ superfamily ATPase